MTWPDDYINKVICGDCLEVMKGIPDGAVEMIWTDPPYGHSNQDGDLQSSRVGVKGGRQREAVAIANDSQEDARRVVDAAMTEAARILTPDCCCCCCCCCGGGPKPSFAWTANRMDSDGLSFFHAVVWNKSARGNGLGWRYRRNYEMVMVAHRFGGRLSWPNDDLAVPNIVSIPPVPNDFHPTTKPVDLAAFFIRNHTREGDIVLDPFAGSGTTLVAAKQLGRRFIGIEINPDYCKIAEDRLRQEELFA